VASTLGARVAPGVKGVSEVRQSEVSECGPYSEEQVLLRHSVRDRGVHNRGCGDIAAAEAGPGGGGARVQGGDAPLGGQPGCRAAAPGGRALADNCSPRHRSTNSVVTCRLPQKVRAQHACR
jgi:hypothetical protein